MKKYNKVFSDMCEEHDVSDKEAGMLMEICTLFCMIAKKRKGQSGVKTAVSTSLGSLGVFFDRLRAT